MRSFFMLPSLSSFQRPAIDTQADQEKIDKYLTEISKMVENPLNNFLEFYGIILKIKQLITLEIQNANYNFLTEENVSTLKNLAELYAYIDEYLPEKHLLIVEQGKEARQKLQKLQESRKNHTAPTELSSCVEELTEIKNALKPINQVEHLHLFRQCCDELSSPEFFQVLANNQPDQIAVIQKIAASWANRKIFATLPSDELASEFIKTLASLATYGSMIEEDFLNTNGWYAYISNKLPMSFSTHKSDKKDELIALISKLIANFKILLDNENKKFSQVMLERLKLLSIDQIQKIKEINSVESLDLFPPAIDDVLLVTINELKEHGLLKKDFYTLNTPDGKESLPAQHSLPISCILIFNKFIVQHGSLEQLKQLNNLYDIENYSAVLIPLEVNAKNISYYYYNSQVREENTAQSFMVTVNYNQLSQLENPAIYSAELQIKKINATDNKPPVIVYHPKIYSFISNKADSYFNWEFYHKLFIDKVYEYIIADKKKGVELNLEKIGEAVYQPIINELIDDQINELTTAKINETQLLKNMEEIRTILSNKYRIIPTKNPVQEQDLIQDIRAIIKNLWRKQFIQTKADREFLEKKDYNAKLCFIAVANELNKYIATSLDFEPLVIDQALVFSSAISSCSYDIQDVINYYNIPEEFPEQYRNEFIIQTTAWLLNHDLTHVIDNHSVYSTADSVAKNIYYQVIDKSGIEIALNYFTDQDTQSRFLDHVKIALNGLAVSEHVSFMAACDTAYSMTISEIVSHQLGLIDLPDFESYQHLLPRRPISNIDISNVAKKANFLKELTRAIKSTALEHFSSYPLYECFIQVAAQLTATWSEGELSFNDSVIEMAIHYMATIKTASNDVFRKAIKEHFCVVDAMHLKDQLILDATQILVTEGKINVTHNKLVATHKVSAAINQARLDLFIDAHAQLLNNNIVGEFKKIAKNSVQNMSNWQQGDVTWLAQINRAKEISKAKCQLLDMLNNEIRRIQLSQAACISFNSATKTQKKITSLQTNVNDIVSANSLNEINFHVQIMLNEKNLVRSRNMFDIFSLFGSKTKTNLTAFSSQMKKLKLN